MNNSEIHPKTFNQTLHIRRCGIIPFHEALELQHHLVDCRRRKKIPDTVLILQHPPVITLGARKAANMLMTHPDILKKKNIEVITIRRGGGATVHNPGQLVFYPVLDLRSLGLGISDYVRKLEKIGCQLLARFGVRTSTRKGFPGLWLKNAKIASIGVRVSKFITYHGMAINIHNDLSLFGHIVPCGIANIQITSVYEQTKRKIAIQKAEQILTALLRRHFRHRKSDDYEKCA